MATYNLFDLLEQISQILNDGHSYAEISEIPADDEFSESLSFSADEGGGFSIGYDDIQSVPNDYEHLQGADLTEDTPCYILTLQETITVLNALDNALEYFKECSANKDGLYDRDALNRIKSSSVQCRNLQAKVRKFLNHIS